MSRLFVLASLLSVFAIPTNAHAWSANANVNLDFCTSASTFPAQIAWCLSFQTTVNTVLTDTSPGAYDDPFFLGWTTFVPAIPVDYSPSTEANCTIGSVECVDRVIDAMYTRWGPLDCDHDAVFGLLYLRTTETYRYVVNDPNYFLDNAFVNHEDAVFADYYFRAFDAWQAGDTWAVPPVWRVAFESADRNELTGMGNAFLGMTAHILRDLPFVLYSIGLTTPEGESRKPDHDKVNEMLSLASIYTMPEISSRYDDTADDGDVPHTTLDNDATLVLIQEWREEAWRMAEELALAPDYTSRMAVAQAIENRATAVALAVREAYLYNGTSNAADSSSRDAFCAAYIAANPDYAAQGWSPN